MEKEGKGKGKGKGERYNGLVNPPSSYTIMYIYMYIYRTGKKGKGLRAGYHVGATYMPTYTPCNPAKYNLLKRMTHTAWAYKNRTALFRTVHSKLKSWNSLFEFLYSEF